MSMKFLLDYLIHNLLALTQWSNFWANG